MRTERTRNADVSALPLNERLHGIAARSRGVGIGELPPVVQPELVRADKLVEVMPNWPFRTVNLSVVHVAPYIPPGGARVKEFAVQMAPTLFPTLFRLNRRTPTLHLGRARQSEPVIFICQFGSILVCRCISIPLDLHCSDSWSELAKPTVAIPRSGVISAQVPHCGLLRFCLATGISNDLEVVRLL